MFLLLCMRWFFKLLLLCLNSLTWNWVIPTTLVKLLSWRHMFRQTGRNLKVWVIFYFNYSLFFLFLFNACSLWLPWLSEPLGFFQDNNLGLVKQVVSSMYKRNIQRLTQTYLTLSLQDIANTVQLNSSKEAEMHVLQMVTFEVHLSYHWGWILILYGCTVNKFLSSFRYKMVRSLQQLTRRMVW